MSQEPWSETSPDLFTEKPLTPDNFARAWAVMGAMTFNGVIAYILEDIGREYGATWDDFEIQLPAAGELVVKVSSRMQGREAEIQGNLERRLGLQAMRVIVKQADEVGAV